MESLMNELRRNGDNLTTARSLRLPSRQMFEDHGQSLVSGSQQKQIPDCRRQISDSKKFKPAVITSEKTKVQVGPATHSTSKRRIRTTARSADIELSDSQSEDEMDLLSSRRDPPDCPSTSQKPLPLPQDDPDEGYLDSDGDWHQYVKGFEPKKQVYSTLRFNKCKEVDKAKGEFSNRALLPPTQPTPPLPVSRQPSSKGLASSSKSKRETSTFIGDTIYVSRALSSKDPNSKPESRSRTSSVKHPSREKNPSEPKPVSEKLKFGPPSRNAHPRIKRTTNSDFSNGKPTGFSTSQRPDSPFFVGLVSAILDVEGQTDTKRWSMSCPRSRSRGSSPTVTTRKLEAFPILSPPSSPVLPKQRPKDFPPLSPFTDSKPQAGNSLRRPKPQADPFPMLSPPSKGEEVEVSRGRSAARRLKGKEKMKENGDTSLLMRPDEDNAGSTIMVSSSLKGRRKGKERNQAESTKGIKKRAKEFPMSTQMLQSIDSSPTTVSPPRSGKRLSKGSGDERISKRSKKERGLFLQSPTRTFGEEGDSLLFSPEVDPQNLCPYCDTPLPEFPSSLLLGLIATTRKKASRDPRPSNPLGLKAPVAVFVTVCQRHRFESQILPEAEKKGWPKAIEWDKVADRIMKMRNMLRMLIEDPGDTHAGVGWTEATEDEWEIPFHNEKPTGIRKQKGPKANNIFWNEVIQEIRKKGSRVVAGVRGQFANFEKAQPGYYGEQGSVIIHQTLYDMFPPASMNASLIAPLTGNEFMEKILVPEVALRLIMEDRKLKGEEGEEEGLKVLRESSSYGVFMFPEDVGEWGGQRRKARGNQLGVGDMIVMQRAMKRRKELEEEREEEERILHSEQETEARRRNNRRDKEPAPTQPRPRPLGKAPNAMNSSQDDSSGSCQPTKKSRSDCKDTNPVGGIEAAVEISDSDSEGGWRFILRDGKHSPSARRQSGPMHSTSRAISGLNLSSDTDTSSRAVRPFTRSRSRSVAFKAEICSSRMEVDRLYEDIIKTPMPTRYNTGLVEDDTPKAPRSPQSVATPPLMKARRRHNKVSAENFRQNHGTPKPPLPTRIHLNYQVQGTSQDTSKWLLEDDSS